MITRIEINGFKTFENFELDLEPLTAIVGPNASGKSNLFDALRFLSLLAQNDIGTAMQGLRGEPEELFRQTSAGTADRMSFALEVLLSRRNIDAFGTKYETPAQRLRYELELILVQNIDGLPRGVYIRKESCRALTRKEDRAKYLQKLGISYNLTINPFIRIASTGDAVEVRQDGRQKHGRPMRLSLKEATRTALSAITTAEFPHLYALKDILTNIKFSEINPVAARTGNDRLEEQTLKSDASNLSSVLAYLKERTEDKLRPDGVLSDIASDLSSLIPTVRRLEVKNNKEDRKYSFRLQFNGDLSLVRG